MKTLSMIMIAALALSMVQMTALTPAVADEEMPSIITAAAEQTGDEAQAPEMIDEEGTPGEDELPPPEGEEEPIPEEEGGEEIKDLDPQG